MDGVTNSTRMMRFISSYMSTGKHMFDLGNFDQCMADADEQLNYVLVTVVGENEGIPRRINHGMCIPAECTAGMLHNTFEQFYVEIYTQNGSAYFTG